MEKDVKKSLEDVLEALSSSMVAQADHKYTDWIQTIRSEYSFLDINKPEECSLLLSLTLDEQADALVRVLLSSVELDSKKKHKLEFVYLHYYFIERHLENLILKFEGLFASSDKSSWLIKTYAHYLTTETLPVVESREFWQPKKGEIEEWVKWIDSMYELYYGEAESYMLHKLQLLKKYELPNAEVSGG